MAMAAIALASCSPDGKELDAPKKVDVFRYQGEDSYQLSDGTSSIITFVTNCPWHIEKKSDAGWLDIDPLSGDPEGESVRYVVKLGLAAAEQASTSVRTSP